MHEYFAPPRCTALYILTRYYKPNTIVETGSYFGHSTLYILAALNRNGSGELHTFDVHPNDIEWYPDLPEDFALGYMVPDELRSDWNLYEGDITETLEPKLDELEEIDLFFHDSDHKESHKRFEFGLAKDHLASDGIIASDDVGHGNPSDNFPASYAFIDLADSLNCEIHASRDFEPGDNGLTVFAYIET